MVGLSPYRLWFVTYETKLGEYCHIIKKIVYPYRKGHARWNLEEPDLEESSANARRDKFMY